VWVDARSESPDRASVWSVGEDPATAAQAGLADVGDERIDAARSGDELAFAAVYRVTHPRLVRYAAALVGQDADDVAAEAWLQIARDLPKFSGTESAFRAWAAAIVRNRALDHIRALSRRPSFPVETEYLDRPASDDTEASAAASISTSEAIAMITSLPREQAEAVLLRAVVGLDANAAAQVLGKRPGAVRVAAHRGLRTLARRLEEQQSPAESPESANAEVTP
jgi:RNA polymerase sigma-70 factor (ECF subfamily)